MKIAKGSYSWILTPIIFSILIIFLIIYLPYYRLIFSLIIFLLILLTILLIVFFRDPDRIIGKGIVSPADGYIREIYENLDNDLGECKIISIFMNIHNVHINRMPIDGEIIDIIHISGSHIPAFKKESERNERVIIKIKTSIGIIKIVQIAGTIARRIVPYVKKNDTLKKGEKIGIIRLGSRVDLYLPNKKNIKYKVTKNDNVKAGISCVAKIND
jgi:phosphatidylserine decarboxylase